MLKSKKYYLSIGSNIGNKLKNIQSAIDLIHFRLANLISISSIYETNPIGFEGEEFFNICACFNSDKNPHFVMSELLEIEQIIGRIRLKESKLMFLLSSDNFLQALKRTQYMNQYSVNRRNYANKISSSIDEIKIINDTINKSISKKESLLIENRIEEKNLSKEK